ncbi:MAG: pyruvate kinase [Planctomycetota bacterium]|nr:pyruvate kinase [Planctomycetota bacterium]
MAVKNALPRRRTKIVCTIGPSCDDRRTLERMIRAGMDVARLNFSHGEHAEHDKALERIREAARRVGRVVGILQDLCGPKIRLGKLPGDVQQVRAGQEVVLRPAVRGAGAAPGEWPVEYPKLADDVKAGDRLLFDDGTVEARVVDTKDGAVRVRFPRAGTLKSRKGLNLPGVAISMPSVTRKDLRDLEWGLAHGVDFVALSFVRRPEDLEPVRARLRKERKPPWLISKIEKPEALNHLPEILAASDGVMVARGDLGVELDFARVPPIQKRMIKLANASDKPVITATQMLESMTQNARPTRAEVSDVSNAILDGTNAVMLSGETAVGRFPVEAVATMSRIAEEAEAFKLGDSGTYWLPGRDARASCIHDALALGVEKISRSLEVHAIVAATRSATTARYLSTSRPRVPVLGLSPDPWALGRMALLWGVVPVPCKRWIHSREVLRQGTRVAQRHGLVKPGDTLAVAVGQESPGVFTGRILVHRVPTEEAHAKRNGRRKNAKRKARRKK